LYSHGTKIEAEGERERVQEIGKEREREKNMREIERER
jgi:hypothetical protein